MRIVELSHIRMSSSHEFLVFSQCSLCPKNWTYDKTLFSSYQSLHAVVLQNQMIRKVTKNQEKEDQNHFSTAIKKNFPMWTNYWIRITCASSRLLCCPRTCTSCSAISLATPPCWTVETAAAALLGQLGAMEVACAIAHSAPEIEAWPPRSPSCNSLLLKGTSDASMPVRFDVISWMQCLTDAVETLLMKEFDEKTGNQKNYDWDRNKCWRMWL